MNPGDYVVVNPNVHDASMPDGRRDGIVLEVFGTRYKNPDQVTVLFSNGAMLKFHKSQLKVLKSKEQFYL
tara:strand:- start:4074 stop:4283 length:210 start_codon:yes stop_codon:yes gene_type:complete